MFELDKKTHRRKMIAPIAVTAIVILYFIALIAVLITLDPEIWISIIGAIVGLVMIAVCIYVLMERIKEIKSGEEDDLDKY